MSKRRLTPDEQYERAYRHWKIAGRFFIATWVLYLVAQIAALIAGAGK